MKGKDEEIINVAVIVGRFQVNTLHEAHLQLISNAVKTHDKVIILLGLSPIKCTHNNPLDFEARRQMIQELFPEKLFPSINILYIKDTKSDEEWSSILDEMITDLVSPNQTVKLYGGRDSFIKHYKGKYKCCEIEQTVYISGTEIRRKISNTVKNNSDFRSGVIWCAENQPIIPILYVHAVIFNQDQSKILVAKSENENFYKFIGGKVNPGETLENSIKLKCEKEGIIFKSIVYNYSEVLDDWRYRGEKNKIISIIFNIIISPDSSPKAESYSELRWIDVNENFYVEFLKY